MLDVILLALMGDRLVAWLGAAIYWMRRIRKSGSSLLFSPEDFRQVDITDADDPELRYPYNSALWKNLGRRCFATDGGWVGCGPRSMRQGDLVVVALGAAVPYVLRPVVSLVGREQEAVYEYVGEAFCHGAMHGELMTGEHLSRRRKFRVR